VVEENMKELTCFKAYDIRGKLGDELNTDVAYRIGRAYGQLLTPQSVVVGGDVRLTSEELKLALADGLMDSGVDVIDIGMTGTEEIYFATSYLNVDGGVEVTASHNPIDYNGMKLVREKSQPISSDTGLNDIKALAESGEFHPVTQRGTLTQQDNLHAYVDHLFTYIDPANIKPLKLVVNAGNGAAGHVIDEIEKRFIQMKVPVEFIKVHHQPDGTFPNGIPNPLLPECRADTTKAVIESGADMGIAWDGDFDRCFLFDEKGNFVEGYYIVGLLAEAFLKKDAQQKIIYDPRVYWNTEEIIAANGGTPVMSKTGHAFIKERMRLEDAVYGGEMSAHHYFRDFAYCDSGMIPWMLVAELLCVTNTPLSSMVDSRIAAYPSSGEINLRIEDSKQAIQRVFDFYEKKASRKDFTDGINFEFSDDNSAWRFNLRTSNTEPVVRLNVESKGDVQLVDKKLAEILGLLKNEPV
jgi:phosphomannomutase